MKTSKMLFRSTLIILILTLLSRLLGLGRETVIAYLFGASKTTDAFLVAYTLPYFFYSVIGTATAGIIVPIVTDYMAQDRQEEAWQILCKIMNMLFIIVSIIVLIGIFQAKQVTWGLSSGFDQKTFTLATRLTAFMMPSILFMTLAGVLGSILNTHNIFGPPAFGPVLMNMTIILAAFLTKSFWGIEGLVFGTVIGAFLFFLIQLPFLIRAGFRYYPLFPLKDPDVWRVLIGLGPILFVTGITQIYSMIDIRFASGLSEGSIATLNYARRLMHLPQALFVSAVTTAIFPTLSRLISEKKNSQMAVTLQKGIRAILLLAVPGSVGLIVLRKPLIAFLFEHGAFDSRATVMTADALLYYVLGLVGVCLFLPLTRGFFALKDTKTPLFVCLITILIKVVLNFLLIDKMVHSGLALASSITVYISMLLLGYILQFRLPGLFNRSFFSYFITILAISFLMGIFLIFFDGILASFLVEGWALGLRVFLGTLFGGVIFVGSGLFLSIKEIRFLWESGIQIFKNRVG